MNDRNLTITDLDPLFDGRVVVSPKELADYLRMSMVGLYRYTRKAKSLKLTANMYAITRQGAEQLIEVMLGEEERAGA